MFQITTKQKLLIWGIGFKMRRCKLTADFIVEAIEAAFENEEIFNMVLSWNKEKATFYKLCIAMDIKNKIDALKKAVKK